MKNRKKQQNLNGGIYRCVHRETFFVGGTCLVVEDRVNSLMPWRGERFMRIAGTNAFYSAVPLSSSQHRLLCYNYCADALKKKKSGSLEYALVLGCGGGALPRWLLETYPSLKVDVVEFSSEIIRVCKKYFLDQWEDSDRLNYYCMDAQDYEPPGYSYQFIFCDLFDGENLAPFVCDIGFAKRLRRMISDDGILVINCGLYQLTEVQQLYQSVFQYVKVINRQPWQTQAIKVSDSAFS